MFRQPRFFLFDGERTKKNHFVTPEGKEGNCNRRRKRRDGTRGVEGLLRGPTRCDKQCGESKEAMIGHDTIPTGLFADRH